MLEQLFVFVTDMNRKIHIVAESEKEAWQMLDGTVAKYPQLPGADHWKLEHVAKQMDRGIFYKPNKYCVD